MNSPVTVVCKAAPSPDVAVMTAMLLGCNWRPALSVSQTAIEILDVPEAKRPQLIGLLKAAGYDIVEGE